MNFVAAARTIAISQGYFSTENRILPKFPMIHYFPEKRTWGVNLLVFRG